MFDFIFPERGNERWLRFAGGCGSSPSAPAAVVLTTALLLVCISLGPAARCYRERPSLSGTGAPKLTARVVVAFARRERAEQVRIGINGGDRARVFVRRAGEGKVEAADATSRGGERRWNDRCRSRRRLSRQAREGAAHLPSGLRALS